jgi:hypothetical protein
MTTVGTAPGLAWAESGPALAGELGWVALLGTLLVWALIAFVAYVVIRLAVRHALQDVARQDVARQDVARQDVARQDVARQDVARQDVARQGEAPGRPGQVDAG